MKAMNSHFLQVPLCDLTDYLVCAFVQPVACGLVDGAPLYFHRVELRRVRSV